MADAEAASAGCWVGEAASTDFSRNRDGRRVRRHLSSEPRERRGPRSWWTSRSFWARVLGLCFLLVGFNLYVGQLVPQQLSLPLAPLVLDPMLSPSDALPLSRGALAGQSVLLVTIDTARPDRLGF